MKRLLALGLLSVAGLGLSVSSASAFFFSKWGCGGCGHGCCETRICVRPYNAFSPISWGNITCDGCMPFGNMGASPMWQSAAPCAPHCGSGCGEACSMPGYAPHFGTAPLPPGMAAPQPSAPTFTPPPPAATTTYQGNPYAQGLMRTGYYPGYYPANYYPGYAAYNPFYNNYAGAYGYNPAAAPNYGYGYGYGQ